MERTKTVKKDKGIAAQAEEAGLLSENKIIWIYGSYQPIINRSTVAMINNEDPNYDFYRIKLGIGSDELFIPVWWNVRNRVQVIQELIEKDIAHLLIAGDTQDRDDKEIHELYNNGQAVFIMPEEIQYHEANAGTPNPPAWHEVKEERDKWHAFLNKHFVENWIEIL